MRSKMVAAATVVVAALVASGTGVVATPSLRPTAVVNGFGTLDLVFDIYSGSTSSSTIFGPILDDKMLFSATSATTGTELWVTDGTTNGTTLLKDINPGSQGSFPGSMTRMGDKVYFQAFNTSYGTELWATDGTADGTTLVKDIYPGTSGGSPYSSSPSGLTALGSKVFFTASSLGNGVELWVTDGTTNGTTLVKDINPGPDQSYAQFMTPFDGKIYFSALSGTQGQELWVSDGTTNGTTLVKDIDPTSCGSYGCSGLPSSFQVYGNKLYFQATDSVSGAELWVTDGTTNGTTLVKDIKPGANGSYPGSLTVVGDKLLFAADNGTNGTELWSSDGTSGGTNLLVDINTGSNSGSPWYFAKIGDLVYFFATDATTGSEPWKSDGTANGTARVADIRTGINGSFVSCMCNDYGAPRFRQYGDSVIIFADDGVNGAEPWITSASTTGATIMADIRPGSTGSLTPGYMMMGGVVFQSAVVGGKFLFGADNGQVGNEIWSLTSPPGMPTSVSAVASTNSAVISWLAPTSASTITSYTVTSNPGAFTCTTSTLSCTVTGLLSNQDYTFTVTATSALGTGAPSLASPRVRTLSPQLSSLLNSLTLVTDIVSNSNLETGQTVNVLYSGFNPYEMVLLMLASNPVVIGSANADANGSVLISSTIPSNSTVGAHHLLLYAPVSGFGARQSVSVSAATGSGSTSGSGSGSGSSSGSGAGSGGTTPSVDPTTLPATGRSDNAALLAFLLFVGGVGLLAGRRSIAPLTRNHPRRSR